MFLAVEEIQQLTKIIEKPRRRELCALQNAFHGFLTGYIDQVFKVFFAVLTHVRINQSVALFLIFKSDVIRRFGICKKFVVVINRLEHVATGVLNRRVINNLRGLAADNADIGCARADVDTNRAVGEVDAHSLIEFVERLCSA